MKVVTLNEDEFKKKCILLADKMAEAGGVSALIGIRTGGATVAKLIFDYLVEENNKLQYFEAGASRYATGVKNSGGVRQIFKYFPRFLLDIFRIVEHYIVSIRMFFFSEVDRSINLDEGLVTYLGNADSGNLFIVDDAIDSGMTVEKLLAELKLINPALEFKVAVLVVTQDKPLVYPDVCLYQKVLLRFPWSSDYN